MNQRLTAPRALTALIARRVVRLATIIAVAIIGVIFLVSGVLAYFFSPWWWLLVIPFLLLFGVFIFFRIITMIFIRIVHPNAITREQRDAMNSFIDKIVAVIEAKSTPLFLVVAICIKDIVFHRDVVTIKNLIKDTASLRAEYAKIEKLF